MRKIEAKYSDICQNLLDSAARVESPALRALRRSDASSRKMWATRPHPVATSNTITSRGSRRLSQVRLDLRG